MVEKQGFEEKEELKSKLESTMEEKFKMEKVRLLFPLFFRRIFLFNSMVKLGWTKLTTTETDYNRNVWYNARETCLFDTKLWFCPSQVISQMA